MDMTPEQLNQLQKDLVASKEDNKKLQEIIQTKKAEGTTVESLQAQVTELESRGKTLAETNLKMETNVARSEAIVEFPLSNNFAGHLTGTPEEIKNKAKEFHETVLKSNDAAVKLKTDEMQNAWGGLPGGSAPGILSETDLEKKMSEAKKIPNVLERIKTMASIKFNHLASKGRQA